VPSSTSSGAPRPRSTRSRRYRAAADAHSIRVYGEAEAEAELAAAADAGATLVAMGEKGYPPALTHVDAPPLLYAKGRLDSPKTDRGYGRCAEWIGRQPEAHATAGAGARARRVRHRLRRGIDTAAHIAARERGTIAVLAGSIDIVYPPENAELQRAIGEQGLLLTERSRGFSPRGKDFPGAIN
jgi:DNA processing protein